MSARTVVGGHVVLPEGAVFESDNGRTICRRCAGSTALHTGRDISGMRVRRLDAADVAEWATYDLGPLRCETGCTTLSPIVGPDGHPIATIDETLGRTR